MSNKARYGMNFTPVFDLCMKYKFKKPIREGKKKRYTLNLLEAYIYGLMCSLHYNGCEIFVSQSGLADKVGCDDKTIRKAIQTLIKAGVIKQKHRYGKSNLYTLLITPEKFAKMCAAQGVEEDAAVPAAPEDAEEDAPDGHDDDDTPDGPDVNQDTEAPEPTQEAPQEAKQEEPKQPDVNAKPLMKRHRDEYGYCELTRDEMNAAYSKIKKIIKAKAEARGGRVPVKLSTIRDKIYGPEYMTKYIIGTHEGTIWREESYWHCSEDVFEIVNKLLENIGCLSVVMDTEGDGMYSPKTQLWDNVRLTTKKHENGTTTKQLEFIK